MYPLDSHAQTSRPNGFLNLNYSKTGKYIFLKLHRVQALGLNHNILKGQGCTKKTESFISFYKNFVKNSNKITFNFTMLYFVHFFDFFEKKLGSNTSKCPEHAGILKNGV